VAALWISGAVIWWTAACLHLGRFRRLLRCARPAPEGVQAQARRVAGRLGLPHCPAVWLVARPVSPMLWALIGAPRLLVPAELWSRLSGPQRDALLAHELAHVRRRDHWVRRFELVVGGLYWWHPLVWWAIRAIQDAAEECCDAWVVWALPGVGPAYAETLLEAATFLSQARSPVPLGASGVGPVHSLKRRLTMILRGKTPKRLPRAGTLGLLGLAAVLLPLQPGWGQSEPPRGVDEPSAGRPSPEVQPRGPSSEGRQLGEAREEVKRLQAELKELRDRMQAVEERLRRAQNRMGPLDGLPGARGSGVEGAGPQPPRPAPPTPHTGPAPDTTPLPPGARPGAGPVPVDRAPGAGAGDRGVGSPRGDTRFGRPGTPGGGGDQLRLQEVERKLDALLREVEALRREVRSQRLGGRTSAPAPVEEPRIR
jgi:hypothetical protein